MFPLVAGFSSLGARHRLFLGAILVLANCVVAAAQIHSVTDGYTPLGLAPGAPAGSYGLSGFESVNPYNGGLNFSLPIKQVSGRGEAAYTIQVPIETKWRAEVDDFCDPQTGQCWHFETPIYDAWAYFNAYRPGELMGRRAGFGTQTQSIGCHYYEDTYFHTITRLTFTVPGGTEYELRDQLLGGQPAPVAYCAPGPPSRGTVFVTADGTSATFVSDTTIYDEPIPGFEPIIFPSGFLLLKDGTRYRIDNGVVSWIRDRNGNKLIFSSTSNGFTVTDSLNRQITVERVTDVAPYGVCDRITFKGFGGTSRIVRVSWTNLGSVLRSGYVLQSPYALWPELNNASPWGTHDPAVISRVWLPDGRSYKFQYNSYGELARAELPTGGAIEYDWAPGVTGSSGGGAYCTNAYNVFAYRRVVERRVYPNGGSGGAYENKMTFSRPESMSASCTFSNAGSVNVKEFNSSGALLTSVRHYYFGSPTASFINSALNPTTYPSWKEGKEWKTEILAANDTTVLRRVGRTWQQRAAVSWWTGSADDAPPNDPRIADITTTLVDTNQVSKQTFSYDDTVPFNNPSDVYEYDFGPGAPGALLRRTHTDYLKTNPVNGINYTTSSIHIRNLPTQQQVFDAVGERARTSFEYDNYAADGSHAPLVNRSGISGLDATFTTSYLYRGNLTRKTNWILSPSTQLYSYAQYDIAGNAVKVIDARGYATTLDFSDCFGAPDGDARLNSAPLELSSVGQASYAFATKVTNALGQTVYGQIDYYLGVPVDGEDVNGIVASGYFQDLLDRPTQLKRAVNTSAASQSTFSYDDTNRIITTTSDLNTNNDGALVVKLLYDQMGRTIETRQYEGGTNYIATQQQYDALGRAFKTSNPFRPWQSESAVWTTTLFDGLGRVTSVTTPDNAVVTTSYSGNQVTVTDQAGKKRKTATDALGRLTQVWEDPNGLNYQTSYDYDVLDSLVKVTQGSQQRFFMYDSLKRLIRARNPEQGTLAGLALSDPITGNSAWSVGYQYDANGNLTQKTDARGVVSTYAYDALNRNTTIDYSDTASINPDVKWFYDGATNGKGRFWYFYKGGDISVGSNVDHKAIDSYDALGRPLVQRQLFKLNGTWGPTYQTSRTYNLAGGVTSQTYPSGRTVSYSYDAAGRTAVFTGNLGDGTNRTYATAISYSPFGGVSREQFGTTTPLYHKSFYNIRGQMFDTRVSSVNDTWDWNRGRLILYYSSNHLWGQSGTDNNGNVRFAETWIPPENAVLDQADSLTEQSYSYDALNRLSSVQEQHISVAGGWVWQQQFRQAYTYDRYGNRTIDAAQTWGTGINNKQFTVNAATNRLGVPVGQSGTMSYDNAGNLTTDTYTGAGIRTYDADNRMLTATDNTGQTSRYTYDAEGNRVRRQVASGQEEWQVYGMDGELLAEYRATSPASSPQKEYGYRDGQLLITATGRFNVALAANGAVATASSAHTCCGFSTNGAINGNNRGPWGNGEGWNDNTPNALPDWIQVDFAGSKTIDEISVFSLHDNYTQENTPTETQTFTLYGLQAFNVQYWNGSSWTTIPGGSVTGNNKIWRKFTFSPITTSKIRVTITAVPDAWSRVVEIQAFGTSAGGEKVQWLVPDHLGTPRMVLDQTGSLANVKRHDYLPFGEELFAGTGGRTLSQGYAADGVRQQFTSYERDNETGLDYAQARYFSSIQGRFTSADPLMASALPSAPQTWNRYSYGLNNPLKYIDPSGLNADDIGTAEDQRRQQEEQQRQQQQQTQVVDLRKDKVITAEVNKIQASSKPLAEGETPVLSDVRVVVGETVSVNNGTVIDAYGNYAEDFTGVVRPVAYIPLDQNGNIIEGNGVAVQENVSVVSGVRPNTTDKPQPTPKGGVFIDTQLLAAGKPTTTIKQAVFVGQFPRSGGPATTVFRTGVNEITKNADTRTVSVKLGPTQKVR